MPAIPVMQQATALPPGADGDADTASQATAQLPINDAADDHQHPFRGDSIPAAQAVSVQGGFRPVQQKSIAGPFVQNRSSFAAPAQLRRTGEGLSGLPAFKPVVQNKTGINTSMPVAQFDGRGGLESKNSFDALTYLNPESVEDVAKGLNDNYNIWAKDDDEMMGILRGPFEANWFKARGALTMGQWPSAIEKEDKPGHDNSLLLMNAMVDMRWRKWKEFSDLALTKIKSEVKKTSEKKEGGVADDVKKRLADEGVDTKDPDLAKTLDPVGSMAVTSDIDLATGGNNTEIAVGLINKEFRSHFSVPYDPGTVFDINVYAADWIHGDKSERKGNTMEYNPNPEVKMSEKATQERDDEMEQWSLVKICRNMEAEQWKAYRDQILAAMPAGPAKKKRRKTLDGAKEKCDAFKERVRLRIDEMSADLKKEEEKLIFIDGAKSAFDEKYTEQAHETRASNAIYEEMLVQVKDIRLRLDNVRAVKPLNQTRIDALGRQLANKIAEALTYANEVYASEGAVQHTVLDQGASKKLEKLKTKGEAEEKKDVKDQDPAIVAQKTLTLVKYNLRKELFQQSANENVGDALHSLHAYHHLPYYAVYRAGKYLARLIEATDRMFGEEVKRASDIPEYKDLKDIGTNAMAIKSKKVVIRGQELEGDPQVVEKDPNFKNYEEGHIAAIEKKIMGYGAKMTIAYEAMNKEKEDKKAKA